MSYQGQAGQDEYVLKVLNYKPNGFFLEIGSNHPIVHNNSYILEKKYNWNGLLVEYTKSFEEQYIQHRTSHYVIEDASKVDYKGLFTKYNFPATMDYLQIDLDVNNRSTLNTLELLDATIFKTHTFATVTFEHDIYTGNHYNTREASREIFLKNGYVLVYGDVIAAGYGQFEDWYVHPSLVDMNFINIIKRDTSLEFSKIREILDANIHINTVKY